MNGESTRKAKGKSYTNHQHPAIAATNVGASKLFVVETQAVTNPKFIANPNQAWGQYVIRLSKG